MATHLYGYSSGKVIELVELASVAGAPGDGSVTNTKLATVPTATIKGRTTAGTGAPEDLTPSQVRAMLSVDTAADGRNRANHTGTQDASTVSGLSEIIDDRVGSLLVAGTNVTLTYNDVANTLTVSAATGAPGADSVTNLLLANMATATIKGRATAGTGDPEDLTATQVRTLLNVADGATANDTDANLKNRANHTGTQLAATISDLAEAVDDRVGTLIVAGANITKTYDDAAGTLTLSATAAASGNFTATGTGARTYPMNDKAAQFVSIEDFYRSDLGDTSYHQAAERALAAGKRDIYFPPRSTTYTWSAPVDVEPYDNVRFYGPTAVFSDNEGAARISCPAGFIINSDVTAGSGARRRIEVRGLSLDGSNAVGSKCIAGCFGGIFHELRISDFEIGIENPASFLSDYDRIAFDGSGEIALSLADANGVSVTRSYFSANWLKHISTTDVTPHTGSDNGMAIYLNRNNHNASGNVATGNSLLTLSGNIVMMSCYFEAFPAASNWGGKFLDIKVNAFGNYGATIINNEMNGGGSDGALNAIYFNGTRATTSGGNEYGCVITGNRFLGFDTATRPAIAANGANPSIHHVRVVDNLPLSTNVISGLAPRSIYRPMAATSSSTSTNISGATYITLPISTTETLDNADSVASSTFTVRKTGKYRLSANVQLASTASNYPDIDLRFTVNGAESASVKHSLSYISGTTYSTAHIEVIRDLAAGDTVQLQARGGQVANKLYFNADWMGSGYF